MKQIWKRMTAFILVVVMLLGMIPDTAVTAYAEEAAVTEQSTEESEKETSTEETTAEERTTEAEMSTELADRDTTAEYQEEASVTEEKTTEAVAAETSGNLMAEETTEQITESDIPALEGDGEYPLFSKEETAVAVQAGSDSGYEFDTDAKQWSGYGKSGWKWYIKSGKSKHYVFCLNEGASMHPGIQDYKKTTGYSGKTSWRFSTALDYFHSINGGWSSNSQYEAVQATIWGSSSPALAKYIDHAWELTSENSGRKSGSDSYSSRLSVVRGSKLNTAADRKSEFSGIKSDIQKLGKSNLVPGTDSTYKKTVSLGGTAWKYFAKGGSGTWSDSSAGNCGDIIVYGIYDKDGRKLDKKCATASVGSNGNVTVMVDPSSGHGDKKENPVTVVMKVKMTYTGTSGGITYLKKSGWQNLSYSTKSEGSAYFGIQAYAETIPGEDKTTVSIQKVDEFGNFVPGCTFTLTGTSGNALNINPNPQRKIVNDENDNFFEIKETGTYTVQETAAAPGTTLNPTVYTFTASEVIEDGVKKIVINDQNNFAIQCKNNFAPGSAHLTKYANKVVRFENGQFVFQEQVFPGVEFKFYAQQDIYCNGTKIWTAGTEIKNGMKWGDSHTVVISSTKTDKNGGIKIENLPPGKYTAKEIPPNGYYVPNPAFNFTVVAGGDTPVNGGRIVNDFVPCSVQITKIDKNTQRALPGTEITLYASVNNKSTDGAALFKAEDTVPVVVSRNTDTGEEEIVDNKWVPIQTAVTDTNGFCSFSKLPNGEYLAAETKAPSGYALCEETYRFEHSAATYTEDMHSGITFKHTLADVPMTTLLVIHKTGEVLAGAEDRTSEHGSYKQLVYEQKSLSGITFGVYDESGELVNTITTNEDGTAKAVNLPFGKYVVKEMKTDKEHILDTKEYKVELSEDPDMEVIRAELNITNDHTKLTASIYKEGEVPVFDDSVTSDEEDIYLYNTEALAGAVFGVYAGSDITNYAGETVIHEGDCLGYCKTDERGIAAYSDILESGNYYFKEVKTADDNYRLTTDTVPFKVVWDGKDISQLVNPVNPVINEYVKGSIKVIKTDGKGKKHLSGVVFQLKDSDGKLLGEYETDKNGEIHVKNLPKGTYYLQEKQTLKGYELGDSIREINLTDSDLDQIVRIKNKNNRTSITVRTNTTINGSGNVRTGDYMIQLLFMLFVLSTYALTFMAGMKRGDVKGLAGKKKNEKIFRKILLFILVAGLVISSTPVYAAGDDAGQISAEESGNTGEEDSGEEKTLEGITFTSNGITYEFDEYYTLTVTEIDKLVTGTEVVIPDTAEYEGEEYAIRLVDIYVMTTEIKNGSTILAYDVFFVDSYQNIM